MKKEILEFTMEKTQDLIHAFSCSSEAKAAANAWLDAIGTEQEALETQKYIQELEADLVPIDQLISFAKSETGAQVFGADAPNVAAHAEEIKAAGAAYCDCPACVAVKSILDKKDDILSALD